MARLVQGMRNIVSQSARVVRLSSAPRAVAEQRCMHSIRLTGMAVPALMRNAQVNISAAPLYVRCILVGTGPLPIYV